ncbi:hypothetical protein CTI14_15830 [Methylobacterium radiotolerans]|nr:hypothetical protein CTI14_15830 [Methylobacterium radiotolerans]
MRAVPAAEAGAVEMRDGEDLVYRAVTDDLTPHLGLRFPVQGSLAGACIREGIPLLLPDVLRDPRAKRDVLESSRLRSCLLVPVRRGGTVVGVLKLQSSRRRLLGGRPQGRHGLRRDGRHGPGRGGRGRRQERGLADRVPSPGRVRQRA